MARALRIESEGAFYHITSRGNDRKRIFFSKTDYDKFKTYLEEGRKKFEYRIHSYVLMTNHYHLLLQTQRANLSKLMHYINGSYTTYINKKRDRSGHLFQGRYKAILVDKDNYLLQLSRYIHLNPVKAGLAEKPQDYPHSSYGSYINTKGDDMVYRDMILGMISKNRKQAIPGYRSFVEKIKINELENPLKDLYGGIILGSKPFIKQSLNNLKDKKLKDEETSFRKRLRKRAEPEEQLEAIAGYLKVSVADLSQLKGEERGIVVYILKTCTELSNKEIGEYFGGLSYSAVAKIKERFIGKLNKDHALKKKVERIKKIMSNVKGNL
ncbi:MAG: transposase [Deltaproteobacteria bacterium]|nr:transposase [Deltaproteobacteria bacterium]